MSLSQNALLAAKQLAISLFLKNWQTQKTSGAQLYEIGCENPNDAIAIFRAISELKQEVRKKTICDTQQAQDNLLSTMSINIEENVVSVRFASVHGLQIMQSYCHLTYGKDKSALALSGAGATPQRI